MSDTNTASKGSLITQAVSRRKERIKLKTEANTQGRHTGPAERKVNNGKVAPCTSMSAQA